MIPRDRLDRIPFFAAFPDAALQVIADRGVERRFAAGETLFRAGDDPRGLMVVLEGKVRVVRQAAGRTQVVHVETVGGTLGEVPLFAGGGYPATAIAADPTTCAVVARDSLAAALRTSPDAAFVLLERLAKRVRELVDRLDRLSLRPVSARLAEYLVDRADGRGTTVITLGMTQQELAEELGTVREVVVRELHALRTRGLIKALGGGRYELVDRKGLAALTGSESDAGVRTSPPTSSRPRRSPPRASEPPR